jgi:hypothetical protein
VALEPDKKDKMAHQKKKKEKLCFEALDVTYLWNSGSFSLSFVVLHLGLRRNKCSTLK